MAQGLPALGPDPPRRGDRRGARSVATWPATIRGPPVAGYTSDELAAPTDNRPGQRAADWTRGCRFSRASGGSIV